MNILIDIGHPAHIHALKHFAHDMTKRGNQVLFTCREKEFIIQLLEAENFNYVSFGKKYSSRFKKIWGLFKFNLIMLRVSLRFKPDIYVTIGSMYAAQISFLLRKPHICIEDTYNLEQVRLYRPFTNLILTGKYEHPVMSEKNEFRMAGYKALAYLHPKRFIPDESVLSELGVKKNDKYIVIRFVAWKASHDVGHKGMTIENKRAAVHAFEKYGRVFISSENDLPKELESYRLPTHPSRIFDVMAYSSLIFGESSTMANEAAILGVPSIFIDTDSRYYTKHIEKDYGLIFNFTESEKDQILAIKKGEDILCNESSYSTQWNEKKIKMLEDKIDVTGFLVWLVENYPQSKRILQENPDYQYNFR